MRISFQILCYAHLMGVVSSTVLADYDLPGIFSNTFCSDDILRSRYEPICRCKETHHVTDVTSICRQHVQFGHCVERHLHLDTWGFLNYTFSKTRFITVLEYICNEHSKNAASIATCVTPDIASSCTKDVATKIKNITSIDESRACKARYDRAVDYMFMYRYSLAVYRTKKICQLRKAIVDATSTCFASRLEKGGCSVQVQYFWSKLSMSYMASKCTKFLKSSRAHVCANMLNSFHPNRRDYTYLECLDVVDMMQDCFILERQYSEHHVDIWYNKGFRLERYIKYERFRCRVQEERKKDIHCETPRRKKEYNRCHTNHGDGFNNHVDLIKNGSDVSVPKICKLYDKLVTCIQAALADCPKANAEHQLASYCGQMPVSCNCPIVLKSDGASSMFPTKLTTMTMFVMSVRMLFRFYI